MRYDEEEKKASKKPKHRPNQRGVGMRTLNEHDADSYQDYLSGNDEPDDDQELLRE